MAKIRVTHIMRSTTDHEFDASNYVGATDYKGDEYPEIENVYDAVRWERQELGDDDTHFERALERIAEDGSVETFIEVVDDESEGVTQEATMHRLEPDSASRPASTY